MDNDLNKEKKKCPRCDGCGRVWGEGSAEVPASALRDLPLGSSLGVMMFPPRRCPDCNGTGVLVNRRRCDE